ncbi:MAG: hypothetical protein IKL79_01195 [Clostridia bacterium]|nr:hypothetical protein [Clostridia bacterium]
MELNREQILQGLRDNDSPYKSDQDAIQNAIALIKQLTEANKRLAERVLAENHLRNQVEYMLKTVKSDTVREFAERLKKCFNNEIEHLAIYTEKQVLFVIDQTKKEMLEGDENDTE